MALIQHTLYCYVVEAYIDMKQVKLSYVSFQKDIGCSVINAL